MGLLARSNPRTVPGGADASSFIEYLHRIIIKMKERISRALKTISIGKYQTTLYNKQGSSYQASVVGGVATILILILFAAILVSSMIEVYSRKRHYVDSEVIKLNAYEEVLSEEGLFVFGDPTCDPSENCKDILVKDFFNIIQSANIKLKLDYGSIVNISSY